MRARLPLILLLPLLLLAGFPRSFAQPNTVLIPYMGTGYLYKEVPINGLPGFESPAFVDTAFAAGDAGFGSPGYCALNTPEFIRTTWNPSSDMLLRKTIPLPAGTQNLRIGIAIDNDVQVFFNGVDVSDGMRRREGCAYRDAFVFAVPDSLLVTGANLLAVRGRDRGVMSYLDASVTADIPQTFPVGTTADSGPGSLREAIISANLYPERDSIVFAIPGEGPHVITLLSPLPALTSPVVLLGGSATALPAVEINGASIASAALVGTPGLLVTAGNTVIAGLRISGFSGDGIVLLTGGGNVVRGNVIGDSAGTIPAGGNGGAGVRIDSASSGNIIGGPGSADGNIISGNGLDGVTVAGGSGNIVEGNTIAANGGNGVSAPAGAGTTIRGNRMRDNSLLGIDLDADGVTPPGLVLTFAAYDLKTVGGTLAGAPLSTYTLEFFDNESPDPSGFGEGRVPLGTAVVTTDSGGTADFYVGVSGPMNSDRFVTATATDSAGSTSEFSGGQQSVSQVTVYGDHYIVNTTFSGIPLHWPNGTMQYVISATVPEEYRDAVERGFAAWDNHPDLEVTSGGVTAEGSWGGDADGRNLVTWVTDGWEELTGLGENAVAATRVRYNASNGLNTDTDLAIDAEHFAWGETPDEELVFMDVENVTAHEAGHVHGLGDIFNEGDPGHVSAMGSGNDFVTMYGLIAFGETSKRTLESPDSAGIAYIYSVVPPTGVDLVLVLDPSNSYAVAQSAFDESIYSAEELLPKMREGDRLGIVVLPSTVALPLTPMGDSTGIALAQAALGTLVAGGPSAIGAGLGTAQGMLDLGASTSSAPAMILFSAGEEDASPTAMSVLGPILSAGTRIFTFGFPGSYGQDLTNELADTTGGGFYLAADSTINQAVNDIWNTLTGGQFSYYTVASSDTFANVPFPGIQYQGPIDRGTTRALPGIQYQGPIRGVASRANGPDAPAADPPSYVLTLVPPSGSPLIDSAYAANNPGLGITFYSGATFQYYSIENPEPGIWTLNVFQRTPSPEDEPVVVSITSLTDLVMVSSIGDLSVAPGATVPLHVAVANGGVAAGGTHIVGGGPVTDAVVSALVTPPAGGTPTEVAFTHEGNGIYAASFGGTAEPGTYSVAFTARKDTAQRTAVQSFYVVPEFDARAVLLATRSMDLGMRAHVHTGDIIVNSTREGGTYELTIGHGAATPGGYAVKASDILIKTGAVIAGDVTYNTLVNNGAITGTQTTPLPLPVYTALPPFKPASPGTARITIRPKASLTLAAGAYGDVTVGTGGTLTLTGGVYHFKSVKIQAKGKVVASAASEIRVLQRLDGNLRCYIGPAAGSLLDARGIVLYVAGEDGRRIFGREAVTLEPNASIHANVYAPFGTIELGWGAEASGAFIAERIDVDYNADITLASAFGPGAAPASEPWTRIPTDEDAAEVPHVFALDQNYPNPFNPSTTIRYELAEPRNVTLRVFDALGREVRTLVDEARPAGSHFAVWDGRNNKGVAVGSGVFYYRLEAGDFTNLRSMILVK